MAPSTADEFRTSDQPKIDKALGIWIPEVIFLRAAEVICH
jgi:hypothetical protein